MKKLFCLSLLFLGLLTNGIIAKDFDEPSLDQKIGQMLIVGFRGQAVDEESKIIQEIKDYNLGGVILFDYDVVLKEPFRNIKSKDQVKLLVQSLQAAASTPLIVAIDQEGGQVQRLKPEHGFPQYKSHQVLGAENSEAVTFEESKAVAMDLRRLGINTNFAPVVDLNVNEESPVIGKKERSFSKDPSIVTKQASSYIKGQHECGILTALKHFPGHGSAIADSHFGFTDVSSTWIQEELIPYTSLIGDGIVDMVMTAHVFNSNLDAEDPATLSAKVITDILRNQMNFQGVIVTDDIQMKAIASHYGFEEGLVKSVKAGVDMMIIGNTWGYDEDSVRKAVNAIKKAVEEGLISEAQIDASYERIQIMKVNMLKGPCSCCGGQKAKAV